MNCEIVELDSGRAFDKRVVMNQKFGYFFGFRNRPVGIKHLYSGLQSEFTTYGVVARLFDFGLAIPIFLFFY